MAKGYGRGMPGMGGGMNMNMLKQAQKMQQDMLRMQQELQEKEYQAASGGGVVSATVNGKHELRALTIDPEAVDPDDVEMLQDMIVAAVNEAMRSADADAASTMQSITGGLGLGGLGGAERLLVGRRLGAAGQQAQQRQQQRDHGCFLHGGLSFPPAAPAARL